MYTNIFENYGARWKQASKSDEWTFKSIFKINILFPDKEF